MQRGEDKKTEKRKKANIFKAFNLTQKSFDKGCKFNFRQNRKNDIVSNTKASRAL